MQFGIFFMDALRIGTSYHWNQPAMDLLLDRLPATLELAMAGLVFAIALSVPLGVLSAVYRGLVDSAAKIFACSGRPCRASGWACC